MVVQNPFPQDTRVRNEANALVAAGYSVSVIASVAPKHKQPRRENVKGVEVYRVPFVDLFKKTADGEPGFLGRVFLKIKSFLGYAIEYFYFTSASFLMLLVIFFRRGFDAIHAHNPPDTIFLAALPFRLIGKKFVFDHHDLSPELYMSRYGTSRGMITRCLRIAEWCSLKLASITIATNESYKAVQIQRAKKKPEAIFIVRNGPALDKMTIVEPTPRLRAMNKTILVYIGCLNPQDGVDYLLRALRHLRYDLKREDFHCVIMGSGDSLEDLRKMSRELGLEGCVELPGYVSEADLKGNLSAADICMDPDPSSPLNDVSTWIKIMEYMAYGKPIVSFDLKETRYSAQDAALFVAPNDEEAFARATAELMDQPERRRQMGEYGRKRVETQLQWSVVSQQLLHAYRYLLGTK